MEHCIRLSIKHHVIKQSLVHLTMSKLCKRNIFWYLSPWVEDSDPNTSVCINLCMQHKFHVIFHALTYILFGLFFSAAIAEIFEYWFNMNGDSLDCSIRKFVCPDHQLRCYHVPLTFTCKYVEYLQSHGNQSHLSQHTEKLILLKILAS